LRLAHNNLQYAVFGRVTKGDDTLSKLERLPTRREGIFVMVCIHLQDNSFMHKSCIFV
jgi:cyclophilin family peptidyl-prolyl cis-trans isomerase